MVGDPVADELAEWFDTVGHGHGRRLLDTALDRGIVALDDPPGPLRRFFDQVDTEPDWLDRDLLEVGARACRRTGLLASLVLRDVALMGGYGNAAINKPLAFTGALTQGAYRRNQGTKSFWIDVTRSGAMGRFGSGFRTAVHVRMMHGVLRGRIRAHPDWRDDLWGIPINQADMIATNVAFSALFVHGLRFLGFRFSKRERRGVLHLWRYVGYLMGVDERLLPASEADSMRALYHVVATICEPDEDTGRLGRSLAEATFQFAEDNGIARPVAQLEHILRAGYTRYVLGDNAGDALGLPRTRAKYFWPAQIPLRLGAEMLRIGIPGLNRRLVKMGARARQQQFPEQIARQKADTSFTPVARLAR